MYTAALDYPAVVTCEILAKVEGMLWTTLDTHTTLDWSPFDRHILESM
jgi:hypothetical protein